MENVCHKKRALVLLFWIFVSCTPALGTDPDATPTDTQPQTQEPASTSPENASDENPASDNTGNDEPTNPTSDDNDSGEEPITPSCADFATFPSATNIAGNLPLAYEPSGITWNPLSENLFLVSDEGIITQMSPDGSNVTNWSLSGDYEGITIADPTSNFVYVGVEKPDAILEFNIATGQITRSFDLTAWMTSSDDNLGLEALTFVPDATHNEGGLFYAGLQETGEVFVFELPIQSSSTDQTVTHVLTFTPVSGRNQISDLFYNPNDNKLYALFHSTMTELGTDGTFIADWSVPGTRQEGLAMDDQTCRVFVAQDSGEVYVYDFSE